MRISIFSFFFSLCIYSCVCTTTEHEFDSIINSRTKIISHRGYWTIAGSSPNSIISLKKAIEIGVYGSEFDVHITSDGIPIVYHDDSINGHLIEDTFFDKLKDVKLKNGEILPTLEQYFANAINEKIQLILEIKPHKSKENERKLVHAILTLAEQYNLVHQIDYISYSMFVCKELIALTQNSQIAYLGDEFSPKELKNMGLTSIDVYYKTIIEKTEWIKEAKEIGFKVNIYIVNDSELMRFFINQEVDYITTDNPIELKRLLKAVL